MPNPIYLKDADKTRGFHPVGLLLCWVLCSLPKIRSEVRILSLLCYWVTNENVSNK